MMDVVTIKPELLELLPNGLPKVSNLDDFLTIMGLDDTDDNWVLWVRTAYMLMSKESGNG